MFTQQRRSTYAYQYLILNARERTVWQRIRQSAARSRPLRQALLARRRILIGLAAFVPRRERSSRSARLQSCFWPSEESVEAAEIGRDLPINVFEPSRERRSAVREQNYAAVCDATFTLRLAEDLIRISVSRITAALEPRISGPGNSARRCQPGLLHAVDADQ